MALPKIELPRHQVTIPSTGQECIMRPYLVKEEKILLLALESQDTTQIGNAIRTLISNCIEGDFEVDKLPGFDIEKLFLDLRGISVGEKIQLQGQCQKEECEHQTPIGIDIKDVKLSDYNPEANLIKLTETIGVTMNYPSIEILESLNDEKLESVADLLKVIVACVATIFDEDNVYNCTKENRDEVEEFIGDLTSDQFKQISDFFANVPTLYHDVSFVCDGCGHQNDLTLRGLASFFT